MIRSPLSPAMVREPQRSGTLENQTACSNTRLVYVESGTDEDSLDRLAQFGRMIVAAYQSLPTFMSESIVKSLPICIFCIRAGEARLA